MYSVDDRYLRPKKAMWLRRMYNTPLPQRNDLGLWTGESATILPRRNICIAPFLGGMGGTSVEAEPNVLWASLNEDGEAFLAMPDGTVLELNGELYFLWSGWEGDVNVAQNIYIAHMSDPCTIDSERVCLSTPTYSWEKRGEERRALYQRGPRRSAIRRQDLCDVLRLGKLDGRLLSWPFDVGGRGSSEPCPLGKILHRRVPQAGRSGLRPRA